MSGTLTDAILPPSSQGSLNTPDTSQELSQEQYCRCCSTTACKIASWIGFFGGIFLLAYGTNCLQRDHSYCPSSSISWSLSIPAGIVFLVASVASCFIRNYEHMQQCCKDCCEVKGYDELHSTRDDTCADGRIF